MPLFFNKEYIYESVVKIVNSSDSIDVVAILGNRYFGKKQLLCELQNHFSQKDNLFVVSPRLIKDFDFSFINSPVKRCYITAIMSNLNLPIKAKQKGALQRSLKSVVGKSCTRHIISLLSKKKFNTIRYQELTKELSRYSYNVLINIIRCLVNHEHLIFFLESYKFSNSDFQHLGSLIKTSQLHPNRYKCIDFVFGFRTSRSDIDLIADLKNSYENSVHLLYLCPPISHNETCHNFPDSCPRLFLTNDTAFRDVHLDDYISATFTLPEYQKVAHEVTQSFDSFAITLSNIFAYESITMDQFNTIFDLVQSVMSERPISRDCYINTEIIYFLQGKYLIPDAWKYYVYFLYHSEKIITDTQDFFFMLFRNIMEEHSYSCNEYLLKIEKLASVEDLSSITKGFSIYYNNLLEVTKQIIKKAQKRNLKRADLELFSDFCANNAFYFSLYLVSFFKVLYDNSQCLFLLDKVLEIIKKQLQTTGVLASDKQDLIIQFVLICFKAAEKWYDVGLYIEVIETLELLLNKSYEPKHIKKIFSEMIVSHNDLENIIRQHSKQVYTEFKIIKEKEEEDKLHDVKLGIITALPKEYEAMRQMLIDPNEIEVETTELKGAGRRFCIGQIKTANNDLQLVALGMCGMGNNKAAIRAQKMITCFPELKYVIMTGIAGGIPSPEDVTKHVRLGDIIISEGVIQYDLITETPEGQRCRSNTARPASVLLEAVDYVKGYEYRDSIPWHDYIECYARNKFKKPPIKKDILYNETNKLINHPVDGERGKMPKAFYGMIGSANILLRNPSRHKELKSKGIYGVEMEGAGIADATWDNELGYLVIRGVCDYCDTHKNDEWQNYAALVAAAYTRALIENLFL